MVLYGTCGVVLGVVITYFFGENLLCFAYIVQSASAAVLGSIYGHCLFSRFAFDEAQLQRIPYNPHQRLSWEASVRPCPLQ